MIQRHERALGLEENSVRLWTMIETARAVLHAEEIASAHPRLDLVVFGPGDYSNELGTAPSSGEANFGIHAGIEVFYARSHTLTAARAAGRLAIDLVFADVHNLGPLPEHARLSRQMGFDGMLALSPRQLPSIHQGFMPTATEVERAVKIVKSYNAAVAKGIGVIAVDGLHVSKTVADAYQMTLDRAGVSLDGLASSAPM
jgi:citrate lyase subunit beta / citryl-CoA lyase